MESQSTRATRYNGDLSLEGEDVGEVRQLNLFRSRHGDALGRKKTQRVGNSRKDLYLKQPLILVPNRGLSPGPRTERPRLVDSRNPAKIRMRNWGKL